ncbi:MAG: hypothetical protein R3D99_08500 [Altererythrobacter sp.]
MPFIHGNRAETALPQITSRSAAGIDIAGITAMEIPKGSPQSILVRGREHDVNMIGHEAIAPDFRVRTRGGIGQEVKVKGIVAVFKKGLLPTVAALRDMVRNTGKNNARETGYKTAPMKFRGLGSCHRNWSP